MSETAHPSQREVIAAFESYLRDVEGCAPDRLLAHYDLPCIFILPERSILAPDAPALTALLNNLLREMQGRGFVRAHAHALTVEGQDDGLAVLSASLTRYRADGSVVDEAKGRYIFRRRAGAWKITAALMHGASGG